jgi:hypothetical protein
MKNQNTHFFEKDELQIEEMYEFKFAERNAKLLLRTLCLA